MRSPATGKGEETQVTGSVVQRRAESSTFPDSKYFSNPESSRRQGSSRATISVLLEKTSSSICGALWCKHVTCRVDIDRNLAQSTQRLGMPRYPSTSRLSLYAPRASIYSAPDSLLLTLYIPRILIHADSLHTCSLHADSLDARPSALCMGPSCSRTCMPAHDVFYLAGALAGFSTRNNVLSSYIELPADTSLSTSLDCSDRSRGFVQSTRQRLLICC